MPVRPAPLSAKAPGKVASVWPSQTPPLTQGCRSSHWHPPWCRGMFLPQVLLFPPYPSRYCLPPTVQPGPHLCLFPAPHPSQPSWLFSLERFCCSLAHCVVPSIVLCVSIFSNDNGTECLVGRGFYSSRSLGLPPAVGGPQRWKLTLKFLEEWWLGQT